jgi:two-component system, NtrC family, sensor kinase
MNMDIETNKLPQPLIWTFLFICVFPMVLTLIGVDFSSNRNTLKLDDLLALKNTNLADSLHLSLSGSFTHTILEWSAFCTAIFTAILAFVHFSIKRDITTPIIALALLFSGCMDAFHTLAADRLIESVSDTQNFIPFTWAICRIFNAMILIVGILFLSIKGVKKIKADILLIALISIMFAVIAFMIIHITATSASLPQTQFPDNFITRPYDVIPLLLFIFAGIYVFPKFNKQNPSIFAHALVISAIPEIAVELHMAFGSTALFDNHFNIAHFLKIFAYLVPFTGLALDYIYTSRNEKRIMYDLINIQDELKSEKDKTDVDLERKTDELKRRIRELDCLYGISTLIMRPGITLPQIIEGTCKLIISTVQHPDIAACSININDFEYASENFSKSNWMAHSDIKLNNEIGGMISVCYFKEPPPSNEFAFTASEQFMINEIAERIGRSVDRIHAQDKLKETYEELEVTQLQLIQAEKMDSIGKLSAGIAHEVKNPLAVIQLGINYIQKKLSVNENLEGVIHDMEDAIFRADSVIKELVDFSASRELNLIKQELNPIIEESLLLVKHELTKHNVNVVNKLNDEIPQVEIDRNKLQQVFINLFMNAIHAMDGKGTLVVRTYTGILKEELKKHQLSNTGQHKLSNNVVVVEIEDTGTGIEIDNENKIFEPFFTTKKAGIGTGLGLTVTENIIRLHNAYIDIRNRNEGGVIVSIMFKAT